MLDMKFLSIYLALRIQMHSCFFIKILDIRWDSLKTKLYSSFVFFYIFDKIKGFLFSDWILMFLLLLHQAQQLQLVSALQTTFR